MPKRKAKRPVGRPKKNKVQPSNEGKIFPVDYGAMRINLYPKEGEESFLYVEKMLPRFYESLNAAQKKVDDIVQQKSSDHSVSLLERNELQECSIMLEALRILFKESLRKGIDTGDFREVRAIALAFTAGQLSVIAPQRQHESDYAAGQKKHNDARETAKLQEVKSPTAEELSDFINAELARHGQKTLAIKKAAQKFDNVSPNTVRNWIKRKGLEFTK